MNLRDFTIGRERLAAGLHKPRHQHLAPYAIVVLRGSFDQTSYAGRVRVGAGHLLVEPTLDFHENRMVSAGVEILRLPWHDVDEGACYALANVDEVARAAERDVRAAITLARAHGAPQQIANDLPDDLALALRDGVEITAWAEARGVARETLSRSFTRAYGVSARRFRLELQARAAWLSLVRTHRALAAIASDAGFADQAHMTRAVHALTGLTPARWRRDPRVRQMQASQSPRTWTST